MRCTRCGHSVSSTDNYCRSCGVALRTGLPAPRDTRLPALQATPPPIPWRGIATVAAGVALAVAQRQLMAHLGRGALGLAARQAPAAGRRLLGRRAEQPNHTVFDSLVVLWRRNGE